MSTNVSPNESDHDQGGRPQPLSTPTTSSTQQQHHFPSGIDVSAITVAGHEVTPTSGMPTMGLPWSPPASSSVVQHGIHHQQPKSTDLVTADVSMAPPSTAHIHNLLPATSTTSLVSLDSTSSSIVSNVNMPPHLTHRPHHSDASVTLVSPPVYYPAGFDRGLQHHHTQHPPTPTAGPPGIYLPPQATHMSGYFTPAHDGTIVPSQHTSPSPPAEIASHKPSPLITQGIGRTPGGRQRSSSRPIPYRLQSRSNSVSVKSETADEDISSLLSSVSSASVYHTPWSAAHHTYMMTGELGQMSLDHRRTQSSDLQHVPSSGSLSGRTRSFSFSKRQNSLNFLETDLNLRGTPAERQAVVQKDLAETAERIKRIASPGQQDKARALWVKRWLRSSYTWSSGATVPRQGLYHSYTSTCNENGLKPINSASFGKIVRSTFPGIKTRRLGVRGNSKYHYVAIQPSIPVEADKLNAYGDSSGQLHIASTEINSDLSNETNDDDESDIDSDDENEDDLGNLGENQTFTAPPAVGGRSRSTSVDDPKGISLKMYRPPFARRHTASASHFSSLPTPISATPYSAAPPVASLAHLDASNFSQDFRAQQFKSSIETHLQEILGALRALQPGQYEIQCRTFWTSVTPDMAQMLYQPEFSNSILNMFRTNYDLSVQALLDHALLSIPPSIHQTMMVFTSNFRTMLRSCVEGLPVEFGNNLCELARTVENLLVRSLQLQQITASLYPILANQTDVDSMLAAWNQLDVHDLVAQCSIMCRCEPALLGQLVESFRNWLQAIQMGSTTGQVPIATLRDWADRVLEQLSVSGTVSMSIVPRAAYATSQVMRELTLRSDPSFGYFHLVKTWTDDYIAITAQRKIAFAIAPPRLFGSLADFENADLTSAGIGTSRWQTSPFRMSTTTHPHSTIGMSLGGVTAAMSIESAEYDPIGSASTGDVGPGGSQLLSLPSMASDGSALTPRPLFQTSSQDQMAATPSFA